MKKKVLVISLVLLSFMFSSKIYGQRQNLIGIDFVNEFANEELRPNFGINYTRELTTHNGIEVGIYYRDYLQGVFNYNVNNQTVYFDILEKYISIPLLYKFSSRFINIYAGPSFEYFVGWEQKSSSANLNITDYNLSRNYSLGLLFKLGKEIKLADKLILEPELRLNPILNADRSYYGFGINLKYNL